MKWSEIRALFDGAVDLPREDLDHFLNKATADPQVRAEVHKLVHYDRSPGGFLSEPMAHLIPASANIQPGDILLRRFRIVRLVEAGGMGQVFEAEDLESHAQRIALKTLDPNYYGSALLRDQFRYELLLARRISHRSVCRVYELHHAPENGLLFLTMEYLEGENLGARLRRLGKLPDADVRRFALQIAGALAAAHRENILHCDLKTSNVILTPGDDGEVAVVTDFGLARPAAMAKVFAIPHGTPAYMAPELRDPGVAATYASDVYSFGVLIHEMVTGAPPTEPLAGTGRWTPLIRQCLAADPQDRPAMGSVLLRRVEDMAEPVRSRYHSRRALVLAVLTMALGGAGFLARSYWPQDPTTTLAILPFQAGFEEPAASLADSLPVSAAIGLNRLRGIRAIGSTSTNRYRGSGKSPSQIAGELGVETLVTGALRTERELIIVNLTITDGATGESRWSRELRQPMAESPSIRRDIVVALATALPVHFDPSTFATARPTDAPEAFAAYALGSKLANERTLSSRMASVDHFRTAVRLDPRYTRARTALANARFNLAGSPGFPYIESLEAAEREVQISLAEDPNLGETHWVYGSILQALRWDWENAERHFRRSIELNPGFAHGHQRLAALLSNLGRPAEAIVEFRLVAQIEPLSPGVQAAYATCLLRAGEQEEAARVMERVQALAPQHPEIPVLHAHRSALAGNWPAAAHALEDAVALEASKDWLRGALAQALFRSGRAADARNLRITLESEGASPMALVYAYAGEGRHADAVAQLAEARSQLDPALVSIGVDPFLQDLQKSPAFRAFLKEMRLR